MADHVFNEIYRSCVQSSVAFLKKLTKNTIHWTRKAATMYDHVPVACSIVDSVLHFFKIFLPDLRCDMSLLLSICLSISWAIAGYKKGI